MTFEEWWYSTPVTNGEKYWTHESMAKAAWDFQQQRIDELEAYLLTLPILYTPEGYVLVPIEPTKRMVFAGMAMNPCNTTKVYKAMIQAAQEQE